MEPKQILKEIESAGAWLPLVTVREAFEQRETLSPFFLDAVQQRAAGKASSDIRLQRVATFGMFFLAQHRDHRLLEPMIQLLESFDPWTQDEWLFSNRLGFFAHRLLAGVCALNAQIPMDLALNPKLKSLTRIIGVSAIGMMAAYGDITRVLRHSCDLCEFSPFRLGRFRRFLQTTKSGRQICGLKDISAYLAYRFLSFSRNRHLINCFDSAIPILKHIGSATKMGLMTDAASVPRHKI
jgi:hypothetical protein